MQTLLRTLWVLPLVTLMACSTDGDGNIVTPVTTVSVSTDDDSNGASSGGGEGSAESPPTAVPAAPVNPNIDPDAPSWDDVINGTLPDNPADDPLTDSNYDTSGIAGFWDLTLPLDGLQDLFYWKISDTGEFTVINYLGDEYDGGDDCHQYFYRNIRYIGGVTYQIIDGGVPGNQFDAEVIDNRLYLYDNNADFEGNYPAAADDLELNFINCDTLNGEDDPVTIDIPVGETVDVSQLNLDTSAVAGLWDITATFNEGTDVFYIDIKADGKFTSVDYFGDSYDQGPECYSVNSFILSNDGDDLYSLYEEDGYYLSSVLLTVNDSGITFNNNDGPYPALAAIDPNIPTCTDADFAYISEQGRAKQVRASIGRTLSASALVKKRFVKH